MLTVTIVTNDADKLWIQVSPVIVGVTNELDAPDGIVWTHKSLADLTRELKGGVSLLGSDLIAIFIKREHEKDRSTYSIIRELSDALGVTMDDITVESAPAEV